MRETTDWEQVPRERSMNGSNANMQDMIEDEYLVGEGNMGISKTQYREYEALPSFPSSRVNRLWHAWVLPGSDLKKPL